MKPILEFRNIVKAFPGVLALNNVSMDLIEGEVHALVGENGAGKSTLIKMLSGVNLPDEGEIYYDGNVYKGFTPNQSRQLGIEIIYQELGLVNELSVAENIFLGVAPRKGKIFLDRNEMERRTQKVFEELGLELDPRTLVGDLTVGYQQMVEISKAVAANAKVLVLDEPTSPLTVTEVNILFEFLGEAKKKGITIIYISHRLEEIFRIADRITVLRDGEKIDTKQVSETNEDELIKLMIGRELKEVYAHRDNVEKKETVLETCNLSGNGVKDISIMLNKGEVLGLGGLVGAGRTEFAELLYGAVEIESGEILLNGQPFHPKSPKQAMNAGITLIPEDRKQQGLLLDMTVQENTSISILKKLSNGIMLDKKKEHEIAKKYKKTMNIITPSLHQVVKNLSGGNQQKVVIAKGLVTNPDIFIFDEPTRGVDVGAKQEIYGLMNGLVASGKSIIMISSEMDELIGMADRIVVFSEGRLRGELQKDEFNAEKILRYASPVGEGIQQ